MPLRIDDPGAQKDGDRNLLLLEQRQQIVVSQMPVVEGQDQALGRKTERRRNSKSETNPKSKFPITKTTGRARAVLDFLRFLGLAFVWDLVLGIWDFRPAVFAISVSPPGRPG